ncbi:MAG: LamG-like jellyroll fold domain-containing protein [Verrucomicrobiota bacterium]
MRLSTSIRLHVPRPAGPSLLAAALLTLVGLTSLTAHADFNPPTDGLVSWWKGDGNGLDSRGGHDGVPTSDVGYVPGKNGQAFNFTAGWGSRVHVTDCPAFRLNSLTIAAWINPRRVGDIWTVLQRGDNRSGLDPYGLGLGGPDHSIGFIIGDASQNSAGIKYPITTYQWHHVAGTFDASTGQMLLYLDGVQVAQTTTSVRPMLDLDTGSDPSIGIGNCSGNANAFPFFGYIDDVLLYSRALSPEEIQLLAQAQSAPQILTQPSGAIGYWGGGASFAVEATALPEPTYLWFKDGFPISWATNSSLVLHDLDFTDAGNYAVQVSNSISNVMSAPATLIVDPANVTIGAHPYLAITGTVGKSIGIIYTTNISAGSTWTSLTNFTLTSPLQEWTDTSVDLTKEPQRFYRIIALPSP